MSQSGPRWRPAQVRFGHTVAALGAVALAFGSIAACSSSGGGAGSSGSGSYVIGITTDEKVSFLADWQKGFTTYIDKVNRAGGINGKKVDLVSLTDGADPARVVANMRQFQSRHVVFVLANTLATGNTAAFPLAAQFKIPIIVPTLSSSKVVPYVYGYAPPTPDGIVVQLNFALANNIITTQHPKVALVTAGDPTLQPTIEKDLNARLTELGGSLVASVQLGNTDTSFNVGAGKIAAAKPDVILSAEGGADKVMMSGLRSAGVKVPVVGYWVDYNFALQSAINDPDFYYFYYSVDPTVDKSMPAVQTMVSDAAASNASSSVGVAGPIFTTMYALGQSVVASLKACGGNCDGAGLDTALQTSASQVNTGGLTTAVGFSSSNHAFAEQVQFVHMVNGAYATVGAPQTFKAQ